MSETTEAALPALQLGTDQEACWSGVFAMTLCVFTLIASEFMPVSLLTPIAGGLSVSEGMTAQAEKK